MFVFEDRVRDTTTTTSTGNISMSGVPPLNYRAFSSVMTTGDTFPYTIVSRTLGEWETGIGTCTAANQFSRAPIRSSNSNALVNFSAGTKDVVLCPLADKATMRKWLPGSGLLVPNVQTSVQGNPASTTETTLLSYTLPANALNTVGQGLWIFAAGYWGNAAIAAQISLYFGSSQWIITQPSTDNSRWNLELFVVMSASNQVTLTGRGAANFIIPPVGDDPTVTLSSSVLIKITGKAVTSGISNQAVVYQLLIAPLLSDIGNYMG